MLSRTRLFVLIGVVFCLAAGPVVSANDPIQLPLGEEQTGAISESLSREAAAAIDRGIRWLAAQQDPGGWWSNKDFPALTALPLWVMARNKQGNEESVRRAVAYILSCVHDNGAIYREVQGQKGGGLPNYNTALCMAALHAVGDPKLVPVIQKARAYVAGSQHLGDDAYYGGMGYDPDTGRPYADLSNSYLAYEAMRLTQNVEDLRAGTEKKVDLNWNAAVTFLASLQHRRESNEAPWASDEPDQKGGFIYKPGHSQAGTVEDKDGTVTFRAYGSMTYAGLLSFIYANVTRDDGRVQAALDWAIRHWTLEENPGMGQEGLYYFYQTVAKALAVYGQNPIPRKDGSLLNWRVELTKKLLALQKIEPKGGAGYWVNEEGRWWEKDPVLVTAYSLLALQSALGR
ncbi:MAG: terpene cyclase/mutase family protein [Kiritimatiellae bacterium]|nr:terpene cyclase/mutase family protein [Kiritimatiellia bacterium]